jgi:glutaconate CoA-transferase subunit B
MSEVVHPNTTRYSMAELVVVEMSRHLAEDDGNFGGIGAVALLPMAAIRLAQLTVAPNLCWFSGGSGAINPATDRLSRTSWDPRNTYGCEAKAYMIDVVDFEMGTRDGWTFLGGMQIDKSGNANMIGIGPYEKLKVRGPGTVGVIWVGAHKTYLYTEHHNRRIFVEKADFVSGAGFTSRGGAALTYTPLCVMDFEEGTHRMRLLSVHPGYSTSDVIANTGFELIIPDDVPMTKSPTDNELEILRAHIDRDGLLKEYKLTVG